MELLMILGADLAYACKYCATRVFQLRVPEQEKQINLFQTLCALLSSLFFLASGKWQLYFSPTLLLYGSVKGLCTALCMISYAKAMEIGSMMLSGVFFNMSLLIPVMYSSIVNHEGITLLQLLGLCLIITTMVLSSVSQKESLKKGKASILWLVMALTAFFTNGFGATIQKVYLLREGKDTLSQFMAWSMMIGGVLMGLEHLREKRKLPLQGDYPFVRRYGFFLLLGLGAGLCGMLGDRILGILCVYVPGAVLYPCINGGLCVLTALASFLFFREKLTPRKLLAVFTGILAIIVLNI